MGISNGIITAPISANDPYTAMGVGSYNGTYDVAYICCNKHGKIAIWSLHKPVRASGPQELTDSQFALNDKSYGLAIINKNTGDEIIGSLSVSLSNIKSLLNYEYRLDAPIENINWSRLTDFIGYYHNATPAIYYAGATEQEINLFKFKNGTTYINVYLETNESDEHNDKNVTLSKLKDCIRWSTLAYGKYHVCCFFTRGNLYYQAMAANNLEQLDVEIVYPIAKTESNSQLGLYTYSCYLGLCSENGDQILPIPQLQGKNPFFTLSIISQFDGRCVVEKIGSYNGLFNGGDIRESGGLIKNYQPLSYYDENLGNNPLHVYNGTGVAFKLNITLYSTMTLNVAEFGIKAFNLPSASEYSMWMQLTTQNSTQISGDISFTANTTVTVYAICVTANIFPPGTSYVPILYCRGAQMAEVIELQIDNY